MPDSACSLWKEPSKTVAVQALHVWRCPAEIFKSCTEPGLAGCHVVFLLASLGYHRNIFALKWSQTSTVGSTSCPALVSVGRALGLQGKKEWMENW